MIFSISCGEIGTVLLLLLHKQSLFHRNLRWLAGGAPDLEGAGEDVDLDARGDNGLTVGLDGVVGLLKGELGMAAKVSSAWRQRRMRTGGNLVWWPSLAERNMGKATARGTGPQA